jgi:ABC-type bacteriocin/lantibiotic exporter with double-glycine peptidase domain
MNKCPSNSLYIFLSILGKRLDYQELEHYLPVDQSGSSLADMRRCTEPFGVRTTVLKLTPEDLPNCPVPAILHCEEEKAVTGHYVILLAATSDEVEYVDGTTAIIDVMPMSEFRKNWSGFVLVPEERPWWSPLLPATAVLGILSLSLGVLTRCFRHTNSATLKRAATHNET